MDKSEDSSTSPARDQEIEHLAARLRQQRPWCSDEQNRQAAQRALTQKPWRPLIIRWSGDKERSGWDYADLFFKITLPVFVVLFSTVFSFINSSRQDEIARDQKESEAVSSYLVEMKSLLLDKDLRTSRSGDEVRGVARGLTLAIFSQITDPKRYRLIVTFLLDHKLIEGPSGLISLYEAELANANLDNINLNGVDFRLSNLTGSSLKNVQLRQADLSGAILNEATLTDADLREANLSGAELKDADLTNSSSSGASLLKAELQNATLDQADVSSADLREADLSKAKATLVGVDFTGSNLFFATLKGVDFRKAKFIGANLVGADLAEANLHGADLRDADLRGADLRNAKLKDIKWSEQTKWPGLENFEGAVDIPEAVQRFIKKH